MEDLALIVISSIISFVIVLFIKDREYLKNKEMYFDKVLVPFYNEYKKNSQIDIDKFYLNNCSFSTPYIPAYVHYLIEREQFEILKTVFLLDYFDLYPNYINIIFKFILYFTVKLICFSIFLLVFMLGTKLLITLLAVTGIITMLINIKELLIVVALGLILLMIIVYLASYLEKKDMYTLNREAIKKIISVKLKRFYRLANKVYY